MTDIERLAREADPGFGVGGFMNESICGMDAITRFAALVAAEERERCAKVCEATDQEYEQFTGREKRLNYSCAAAIRALAPPTEGA